MRKLIVLAACLVLVATACSSGEGDERDGDGSGSGSEHELIAQVASYDLAAGEKGRFIVGLLTQDNLFISHGSVEMEFSYIGTEEEPADPIPGPRATGEFIVIPGDEPNPAAETPVAGPPSQGRGVYGAEVIFDEPGFWEVLVTANVDGLGEGTGKAAFEVLDEHRVPAVGDKAPRTDNHTIGAKGVPKEAIDSRALEGAIPDPELHEATVAESIAKGRPVLLTLSTPVFCVSRFCGPITDMVAELAKEYSDRADFIHIEVWRNFENQVVNKAAAEWILRGNDLHEPWVFLIDGDGRIISRLDNVASREEIEPLLKKLPKL